MSDDVKQTQDEFHLPIELKTVLKSIKGKWFWILLLAVISAGIGVFGALKLGSQVYSAATVLAYQPIASVVSDSFQVYQNVGEGTELTYEQSAGVLRLSESEKSLSYQINMVKILPNLEAVRQTLQLSKSLHVLGSSIQVYTEGNTNLMTIKAESESAEEAMDIANTMRDIFLSRSNEIVGASIRQNMETLKKEYDRTFSALKAVNEEFSAFITENKITNLDVEIQKISEEMVGLQLSLPKTSEQIELYRQQIQALEAVLENISAGEISELVAETTAKIQEYQKAIVKEQETYLADKEMYDSYYTQSRAAQQIDFYRQQIDSLQNILASVSDDRNTILIQETQSKLNDYQLALIEAEGLYRIDSKRYALLQSQYNNLPKLKQDYIILAGKVASLEAETKGLAKVLDQYEILSENEYSDFVLISSAVLPLYPVSSNKKLIAIGATAGIFILGFTLMLLLIVLDTRIKSAGDARQKLQESVIGAFRWESDLQNLIPCSHGRNAKYIEAYRILARTLRQSLSRSGGTILITSTAKGEGKTTTALNLAAVFGRQDERVLIIDANIRAGEISSPLLSVLSSDTESITLSDIHGLGDYLTFYAAEYEEIITPSVLPGVDVIAGPNEAVIPDFLHSHRMEELMTLLKEIYSIIIIEGAPAGDSVDSVVLAQYCDAIIYVTAAGFLKPDSIQIALKRIQAAGVAFRGIILTKIKQEFFDGAE